MRELYRGLSGADVQRWGRFLIREGHLPNWRGRTFDAELEAATRSFQRGSQLEASGRADGNTLAAALAKGLLDPHLDDPADHSAPALKGTALTILIPIVVALIVGIFGGIGALVNWQSNIDVEREKLKSSIILQASNSTDRNQVISNLSFFKRLKLIDIEDEILIGLQDNLSTVPITAGGTPGAYGTRVFLQFAGSLTRSQMIDLAKKLQQAGWPVQGADRGGQRTGLAAGYNEVRFGVSADEIAAKQLADLLNKEKIVQEKILPVKNENITQGTLEIWISI